MSYKLRVMNAKKGIGFRGWWSHLVGKDGAHLAGGLHLIIL